MVRFALRQASMPLSASDDSSFSNTSINQLKGLILAQNERWRRGLGMQVEREACFGRWTAAKGTVMRRDLPSGPG